MRMSTRRFKVENCNKTNYAQMLIKRKNMIKLGPMRSQIDYSRAAGSNQGSNQRKSPMHRSGYAYSKLEGQIKKGTGTTMKNYNKKGQQKVKKKQPLKQRIESSVQSLMQSRQLISNQQKNHNRVFSQCIERDSKEHIKINYGTKSP